MLVTFVFRDKIIEAIINLVEYSNEFAMYVRSSNEQTLELLDNFARHLFAWRGPYPKFFESQARAYRIRIKNVIK